VGAWSGPDLVDLAAGRWLVLADSRSHKCGVAEGRDGAEIERASGETQPELVARFRDMGSIVASYKKHKDRGGGGRAHYAPHVVPWVLPSARQ
jgi:hypothetical protein